MVKFYIPKLRKIILAGLLIAVYILLDRVFTISTPIQKINLSLIAVMLTAIILGWKYAVVVGALGDLIGAITMPFGPYFPGFTLSAALIGFIYGVWIYRNPNKEIKEWKFILNIIVSNVLALALISVLLNGLWLYILMNKAYTAILAIRITEQAIMLPIQIVLIYALERGLRPFVRKYLYEEEE
ncbi:MAG: folate family ECF transporter S component [Oscillospiraceae bacterium]|nr:folate family ECF transporter S component [Oscillospiraceae bacterium]